MRCYLFFIVEIIVGKVNLIDVKIESYYYHHDGEQLGFYKKITYQNTEQKERPLVNLLGILIVIGVGAGTYITNTIISSSIRLMDTKLSRVVT